MRPSATPLHLRNLVVDPDEAVRGEMPVFQPSNQIKLTNVAVIRLKKGGKRFEIAAYPNKVREWRSGAEKDLSEVLQIENVFVNVSKGQAAKADDLQKAFGSTDTEAIVLEILKKGEMQVGDKERAHELENLRREVATQVAERCVDPTTQRPHTVTMIEKAMDQIHYNVNTKKSAKSQALELIKTLQDSPNVISLQRASMRIRVTLPSKEGKKLKERILPLATKVEVDETDERGWEMVALIDPGQFKVINELLQQEGRGATGKLETLSFSVVEGD